MLGVMFRAMQASCLGPLCCRFYSWFWHVFLRFIEPFHVSVHFKHCFQDCFVKAWRAAPPLNTRSRSLCTHLFLLVNLFLVSPLRSPLPACSFFRLLSVPLTLSLPLISLFIITVKSDLTFFLHLSLPALHCSQGFLEGSPFNHLVLPFSRRFRQIWWRIFYLFKLLLHPLVPWVFSTVLHPLYHFWQHQLKKKVIYANMKVKNEFSPLLWCAENNLIPTFQLLFCGWIITADQCWSSDSWTEKKSSGTSWMLKLKYVSVDVFWSFISLTHVHQWCSTCPACFGCYPGSAQLTRRAWQTLVTHWGGVGAGTNLNHAEDQRSRTRAGHSWWKGWAGKV